MYRLFTALALLRFLEYALVTILIVYGGLEFLSPLVTLLLVSAFILALIAIISRTFSLSEYLLLLIVASLTIIDAYLMMEVVLKMLYLLILSLYIVSLINIIIDCILILISIELLKR